MRQDINEGLALIFQGIARLKSAFPSRAFTIDGRLVGDVGEVIAALEYDLTLDVVQRSDHDAITADGRRVQIKATFKDTLTFRTRPDYYLGFKLFPDGSHEEVFNGPGHVIWDRYASRKGIGVQLLSFPITEIRRLSQAVAVDEKIRRRESHVA